MDAPPALRVAPHTPRPNIVPSLSCRDMPQPQMASEVYNATIASEGVLLLPGGDCFMPLQQQHHAAIRPQVHCYRLPHSVMLSASPNSCHQPSISSLNCDFVQRHADGSFSSSSCRPCRRRHLHAAVLLLQPSSHAYFHFMFETLPRLQLSLEWMRHHENCSILVDTWHGNTWSAQALQLLGLGDKVVARQAHVRYSVGIAFVPPAPPAHHTFPTELNVTVQKLLVAAGVADGGRWDALSGSVLLIRRASSESQHSVIHSDDCPNGVRMREVLNMKEVETALRAAFGPRLLVFRSHGVTLAQQIKAFRNASMVIGVHGTLLRAGQYVNMPSFAKLCAGAGLVNTMFCRQGTPVVEIIPHVRPAAPRARRPRVASLTVRRSTC